MIVRAHRKISINIVKISDRALEVIYIMFNFAPEFYTKHNQWQQKSDCNVMVARIIRSIQLLSPIAGHHEMVDLLKG